MTVLVMASFPEPAGADRAAGALMRLVRAGRLGVHGSASARWYVGGDRPLVRRYAGDPRAGVVDEVFWGLVLGVALGLPLAAAARGAAGGLGPDILGDIGIADRFLNRIRDEVVPGRSVLLVLAPRAYRADVVAALLGLGGEAQVLEVAESEARALRAAFGG